jgi:SAM-dependent methyltransferase
LIRGGRTSVEREHHWNTVYRTKGDHEVSWFEELPVVSLEMLAAAGVTPASCVLDVGGGDSRLVDALVDRGLSCLTVLDVSQAALERSQRRLGQAADRVRWLVADVAGEWSIEPVDVWHDRAVFHFLVDERDRRRYRDRLATTLKPGGCVIIATFASDGPERCSGLPVQKYSPEALAAELGERFALVETVPHQHSTPWGARQSFQYSRFARTT